MGSIDWIPIADMPDALKDGRDVLLWDCGAYVGTWIYGGWFSGAVSEMDGSPIMVDSPDHYAEINPPI